MMNKDGLCAVLLLLLAGCGATSDDPTAGANALSNGSSTPPPPSPPAAASAPAAAAAPEAGTRLSAPAPSADQANPSAGVVGTFSFAPRGQGRVAHLTFSRGTDQAVMTCEVTGRAFDSHDEVDFSCVDTGSVGQQASDGQCLYRFQYLSPKDVPPNGASFTGTFNCFNRSGTLSDAQATLLRTVWGEPIAPVVHSDGAEVTIDTTLAIDKLGTNADTDPFALALRLAQAGHALLGKNETINMGSPLTTAVGPLDGVTSTMTIDDFALMVTDLKPAKFTLELEQDGVAIVGTDGKVLSADDLGKAFVSAVGATD
jgi:hypothetical protein